MYKKTMPLVAKKQKNVKIKKGTVKNKNPTLACGIIGGDNWNRTSDPMHVKHVL